MANLSNINGKFVVEQTTGYVGVGTTDPNFLIEAAGANSEIALNSTSGSIYRVRSTSSDAFIITKNGVGDRLVIDGAGNSTFSGKILVGVGTTAAASINAFSTTVSTGLHSALRIISQPSASNYWDIGATGGASTLLNFYHNGSTTPKISFTHLGGATFAGNVGIGTTSPGAKLDVDGTIRLSTSGRVEGRSYPYTTNIGSGANATTTNITAGSSIKSEISLIGGDVGDRIEFKTNSTERMRIESDGTVQITNSTSPKLQLKRGTKEYTTRVDNNNKFVIQEEGGNEFFIVESGASSNSIRIDSSGNVGIGTTGMNTTLNLYSSSNTQIGFQDASTGTSSADGFRVGYNGTYGQMWLFENAAMRFATNNVERMRITSSAEGHVELSGTAPVIKATASNGGSGLRINIAGQTTGQLFRVQEDGATKFQINENGNVGIGTTSPNQDGYGASTKVLSLKANSSGGESVLELIGYGNSDNDQVGVVSFMSQAETTPLAAIKGLRHTSDTSGKLAFYTSNSERMRITSGGLLFVGDTTTNYGYLSHHIARDYSQGYALIVRNSNTSTQNNSVIQLNQAETTSTTQGYFLIGRQGDPNSGTNRIFIYSNGDVKNQNNSYGAISDERLKENIVDATPKLDDLMKVKVRNFNLKGEETKQIGVVAQELEQVFPSMIEESKDPDSEDETLYKGVKYSVFVPMLIKALQELKADNDSLKARIETLENK